MDGRTYRYFKGDVLYPFGHGLSYTTFNYAIPSVSAKTIKAGDAVDVTVDVTNAGKMDSDEVVQLYIAKPNDTSNPVLAGFARVNLKAGQTKPVTLKVDARALSLVDEKGIRKVQAGDYTLHLGGGQPKYAKTAAARLTVTGEALLPK
ncbi:fibronectin type III-like domain-contianing protein [Cellvibrio sp.]